MSTSSGTASYHEIEVKPLPELPHCNSHESREGLFGAKQYEGGGSKGRGWSDWVKWRRWPSSDGPLRVKNWKPMTLRAPVLGLFIVLSISLIVILELLARATGLQQSLSGSGAVAYADQDGNLSTADSFLYLYFPTVVAVCYSMLWSWIDLDVKRLEPWFQLSKKDGASAGDSLLLQYPFEFLAFVPFKAAKRRHWAVFHAGMAMMLIFWVITPLQSAIFGTGTVTRTQPLGMRTTAELKPVEAQVGSLNANFLMTAYGIGWLGQSLPPFTTTSYAVMPFEPITPSSPILSSEVWSTNAEVYRTNLTCIPAKTRFVNGSYEFDNGKGCRVSNLALVATGEYFLAYIGYYNDPHADWGLANSHCPLNQSHNFLAVWAEAASQDKTGEYHNVTAIFCEPNYSVYPMTIQLNASDNSITKGVFDEADFLSAVQSQPLSEQAFNITNFEYLIGAGVIEQPQVTDFPNTEAVEQFPRFAAHNLAWPSTNMVGFAAMGGDFSPAELRDPDKLRFAFLQAHQLLFTTAFSALLDPVSASSKDSIRDGITTGQPFAIIYVRVFSLVVEAILGLVCLMATAIWYMSARRPSQLVRDPARIGDIMTMVSECHALKHLFMDMGAISQEQMAKRLLGKRFRLRGIDHHEPPIMHLEVLGRNDDERNYLSLEPSRSNNGALVAAAYLPFELRTLSAYLFIGSLGASVSGLVYLYVLIYRSNGLELPSPNAVIRQILENYMPTLLATAIEPFWMVLNRMLCILKPFDELRKGAAKPSRSIDVKYTSLPPPLAFWRALRSHHFLLATVCLIAMLANVLAVSLSGLLNEALTSSSSRFKSKYTIGQNIDSLNIVPFSPPIVYSDHFYVTRANYLHGTNLPPWMSPDFFFLPIDLNINGNSDANIRYTTTTRGYGVEVKCSPIKSSSGINWLNFTEHGDVAQLSITHQAANGTRITCVDDRNQGGTSDYFSHFQSTPGTGANAFEVVAPLRPLDRTATFDVTDGGECEKYLMAGFTRLGRGHTQTSNTTNPPRLGDRAFDSLFLLCEPTFQTAMFDVAIDATGRILDASQTSPFEVNVTQFFSPTAFANISDQGDFSGPASNLIYQAHTLITFNLGASVGYQWHNTTTASDWVTYLLSVSPHLQDPKSLLDPLASLPSPEVLAPALEALYRQLFVAILGLNTHIFALADHDGSDTVSVTMITPTTRIFISDLMFKVSLTILILNFLVGIAYYVRRPKAFLPMMPVTIAAIAGLVVGTRAVEDYSWDRRGVGDGGWGGGRRGEDLRYGYGRFVGTDGRLRVGIEREPWVLPLDRIGERRAKRKWWWFGWFGTRK